jgi:WD40 repeat protein
MRDINFLSTVQVFECFNKVHSCSFSDDAKYLAIGCKDSAFVVHDVLSGALTHSYPTWENGGTRDCTFLSSMGTDEEGTHGDKRFLLSADASLDGSVQVRNLRTGTVKQKFESNCDVLALDFSMDGKYLASCGADSAVTIRNAQTGDIHKGLRGENGDGSLKACAFSPSSKVLACGTSGKPGKARLFDVETGKQLGVFETELKSKVNFMEFLDECNLAVGSVWELTVYDLKTKKGRTYKHRAVPKTVGKHRPVPVNEGWSISGAAANIGVCGGRNKILTLVDLTTMKMQEKVFDHGESIKTTAVTKSGGIVACGGKAQKLTLYVLSARKSTSEGCPSHDLKTAGSIDTLAFSKCEKLLAVGDGGKQVSVYNIEGVYNGKGDVLLHRFGLQKLTCSLCFSGDGRVLGCVGKDNCGITVWDMGDDCDPYPYECSMEWYLQHHVKKKPHLLYRRDYRDREGGMGNTIIHRLVEEGTAAMLKEGVGNVEGLLPVENDKGLTPLEIAVHQNDFDKTQFLIEKYTETMTPILAGHPMFPRLLGAKSRTATESEEGSERITSRFPSHSNRHHYSTLVHKFPGLCVDLLNKSTISVQDQTVDVDVTRLWLDTRSILKKSCDGFWPVGPLWCKTDELEEGGKNKHVEVESFITGYKDFITREGSFKTMVRSENAAIFETTAMQRAIEYKWETYGLRIYNWMFFVYTLMVAFFLISLVFAGGKRKITESKVLGDDGLIFAQAEDDGSTRSLLSHAILMSCSAAVSQVIAYKEYWEFVDGKWQYLQQKENILDITVIIFTWILTAWAWYDYGTDGHGGVIIGLFRRLVISFQIGACLLNLLLYLSSYKLIGATYSMIVQVMHDFKPIFIVMVLSIFAYTIILRTLLLGPEYPDGESPYNDDTSPFEEPDLPWTKVPNLINIAFAFGFLGAYEDPELRSTQEEVVGGVTTRGGVLNFFSWVFFMLYALFSNIILLNLLIAVMADSYDHVKEREAVEQRIKRAKTLCDIDRVWGNTFSDSHFPKCLHFLTQKGKSVGGPLDDDVWEGKVTEMRRTIENASNDLTTALKEQLGDVKAVVKEQDKKLADVKAVVKEQDKKIDLLVSAISVLTEKSEKADQIVSSVSTGKYTYKIQRTDMCMSVVTYIHTVMFVWMHYTALSPLR